MAFTLPPLNYSYDALEPSIDEQTMHYHHDKHHQTYIDKLNSALQKYPEWFSQSLNEILQSLDKLPQDIQTLVRHNGGGTANHNLYWEIMAPDGTKPSTEILQLLDSRFGGFKEFQELFSKIAADHFASGWAWLTLTKDNQLKVHSTSGHDTPVMEGDFPLLVLDVWEHAYYLKYQNRRAEYIQNWWSVVNWQKVEENYKNAKSKI
jgi:Fe-Mn family superoxide dismutase